MAACLGADGQLSHIHLVDPSGIPACQAGARADQKRC